MPSWRGFADERPGRAAAASLRRSASGRSSASVRCVLSRACPDKELSQFFAGLLRSENGHFATFLRLARLVRPAKSVAARWQELLEHEATVIAAQPRGSRVHSGPPPS